MSGIVIIPVLNCDPLPTVSSAVAQTVRSRVLVIDQHSQADIAKRIEHCGTNPLVRLWRHAPVLPSLAATWNAALDYAWEAGARDALVINHDVQLPPYYYEKLRERIERDGLLFLSGVGVNSPSQLPIPDTYDGGELQLHPDFSAYLITRRCHQLQRFDEGFTPAYCEDVDYHRQLFILGEGHLVGKINIPYLHNGSMLLKQMDAEERRQLNARIDQGSRAHYMRKWGGPVNEERRPTAYAALVDFDVTTGKYRSLAEQGKRVWEYLNDGPTRSAQPA